MGRVKGIPQQLSLLALLPESPAALQPPKGLWGHSATATGPEGTGKGALLLPQRLLDPESIYCTTPYLETENDARDT